MRPRGAPPGRTRRWWCTATPRRTASGTPAGRATSWAWSSARSRSIRSRTSPTPRTRTTSGCSPLADPYDYAGHDIIDASGLFADRLHATSCALPTVGITAYGGLGDDLHHRQPGRRPPRRRLGRRRDPRPARRRPHLRRLRHQRRHLDSRTRDRRRRPLARRRASPAPATSTTARRSSPTRRSCVTTSSTPGATCIWGEGDRHA